MSGQRNFPSYRNSSPTGASFLPPLSPLKPQEDKESFLSRPPSGKRRPKSRPTSATLQDDLPKLRPRSGKSTPSPRQSKTVHVRLPSLSGADVTISTQATNNNADERTNKDATNDDRFSDAPVLPAIGISLNKSDENSADNEEESNKESNKSFADDVSVWHISSGGSRRSSGSPRVNSPQDKIDEIIENISGIDKGKLNNEEESSKEINGTVVVVKGGEENNDKINEEKSSSQKTIVVVKSTNENGQDDDEKKLKEKVEDLREPHGVEIHTKKDHTELKGKKSRLNSEDKTGTEDKYSVQENSSQKKVVVIKTDTSDKNVQDLEMQLKENVNNEEVKNKKIRLASEEDTSSKMGVVIIKSDSSQEEGHTNEAQLKDKMEDLKEKRKENRNNTESEDSYSKEGESSEKQVILIKTDTSVDRKESMSETDRKLSSSSDGDDSRVLEKVKDDGDDSRILEKVKDDGDNSRILEKVKDDGDDRRILEKVKDTVHINQIPRPTSVPSKKDKILNNRRQSSESTIKDSRLHSSTDDRVESKGSGVVVVKLERSDSNVSAELEEVFTKDHNTEERSDLLVHKVCIDKNNPSNSQRNSDGNSPINNKLLEKVKKQEDSVDTADRWIHGDVLDDEGKTSSSQGDKTNTNCIKREDDQESSTNILVVSRDDDVVNDAESDGKTMAVVRVEKEAESDGKTMAVVKVEKEAESDDKKLTIVNVDVDKEVNKKVPALNVDVDKESDDKTLAVVNIDVDKKVESNDKKLTVVDVDVDRKAESDDKKLTVVDVDVDRKTESDNKKLTVDVDRKPQSDDKKLTVDVDRKAESDKQLTVVDVDFDKKAKSDKQLTVVDVDFDKKAESDDKKRTVIDVDFDKKTESKDTKLAVIDVDVDRKLQSDDKKLTVDVDKKGESDDKKLIVIDVDVDRKAESDDKKLNVIDVDFDKKVESEDKKLTVVDLNVDKKSESDDKKLMLVDLNVDKKSESDDKKMTVVDLNVDKKTESDDKKMTLVDLNVDKKPKSDDKKQTVIDVDFDKKTESKDTKLAVIDVDVDRKLQSDDKKLTVDVDKKGESDDKKLIVIDVDVDRKAESDDKKLNVIDVDFDKKVESEDKKLTVVDLNVDKKSESDDKKLMLVDLNVDKKSESDDKKMTVVDLNVDKKTESDDKKMTLVDLNVDKKPKSDDKKLTLINVDFDKKAKNDKQLTVVDMDFDKKVESDDKKLTLMDVDFDKKAKSKDTKLAVIDVDVDRKPQSDNKKLTGDVDKKAESDDKKLIVIDVDVDRKAESDDKKLNVINLDVDRKPQSDNKKLTMDVDRKAENDDKKLTLVDVNVDKKPKSDDKKLTVINLDVDRKPQSDNKKLTVDFDKKSESDDKKLTVVDLNVDKKAESNDKKLKLVDLNVDKKTESKDTKLAVIDVDVDRKLQSDNKKLTVDVDKKAESDDKKLNVDVDKKAESDDEKLIVIDVDVDRKAESDDKKLNVINVDRKAESDEKTLTFVNVDVDKKTGNDENELENKRFISSTTVTVIENSDDLTSLQSNDSSPRDSCYEEGEEEVVYFNTAVVNIQERFIIEVYRTVSDPRKSKPNTAHKRTKSSTRHQTAPVAMAAEEDSTEKYSDPNNTENERAVNQQSAAPVAMTSSSIQQNSAADDAVKANEIKVKIENCLSKDYDSPAIHYSTATTIVGITEPGVYKHKTVCDIRPVRQTEQQTVNKEDTTSNIHTSPYKETKQYSNVQAAAVEQNQTEEQVQQSVTSDTEEDQIYTYNEALRFEKIQGTLVDDPLPVPLSAADSGNESNFEEDDENIQEDHENIQEEESMITTTTAENNSKQAIEEEKYEMEYSKETLVYTVCNCDVIDQWANEDFIYVIAKQLVDIALTRVLNEELEQPAEGFEEVYDHTQVTTTCTEPVQHANNRSKQDNTEDMADVNEKLVYERIQGSLVDEDKTSVVSEDQTKAIVITTQTNEDISDVHEKLIYERIQASLVHEDEKEAEVMETYKEQLLTTQNNNEDIGDVNERLIYERIQPTLVDDDEKETEVMEASEEQLLTVHDNTDPEEIGTVKERIVFETIQGTHVDEEEKEADCVVMTQDQQLLALNVNQMADENKDDEIIISVRENLIFEQCVVRLVSESEQQEGIDETDIVYCREVLLQTQDRGTVQEMWATEDFVDMVAKALVDIALTLALNQTTDTDSVKEVITEPVTQSSVDEAFPGDEALTETQDRALACNNNSAPENKNGQADDIQDYIATSSECLRFENIVVDTILKSDENYQKDNEVVVYSREYQKMVVDTSYVQEQWANEDFVDVVAKILVDIAIIRVLNEENAQDNLTPRERTPTPDIQEVCEENTTLNKAVILSTTNTSPNEQTTNDEPLIRPVESLVYESVKARYVPTPEPGDDEDVIDAYERGVFEQINATCVPDNEDEESESIAIVVCSSNEETIAPHTHTDDNDQSYQFGLSIKTDQFYLDKDVAFLNHGSFGAVPKDVVAQLERVVKDYETNPDDWERTKCEGYLDQSLDHVSEFVGADNRNMAFVESTIRGIKRIFAAIDIDNGDEIILNNWTVKGVRKVVNSVCKIFTGVKCTTIVHDIPIKDPADIVQQYSRVLQSHNKVKIVIVDHISSAPSIQFPIKELVELCHAHGVMIIVNGAHGPGHVPINLTELDADFYVGNLSKWAFAPTGCSFIWTHPIHRAKMVEIKHLFKNDREISRNQFVTSKYALDFFNRIGGWPRISAYNCSLLDEATVMLSKAWNTSILAVPKSMEAPFMRCVLLPHFRYIPRTPEGASDISKMIWKRHKIWAPVFCCNRRLYVRISANVYCVEDDYIRLKDAVLQLKYLDGKQVEKVYTIDKNKKQASDDDTWSMVSLAINA